MTLEDGYVYTGSTSGYIRGNIETIKLSATNQGTIKVTSTGYSSYTIVITDSNGSVVGSLSNSKTSLTIKAGTYT